MKKIVAIGIISGVVLYVFFNSYARQLEGRGWKQIKEDDIA